MTLRSRSSRTVTVTAAILASAWQPARADQPPPEGTALSSRTVTVSREGLSGPSGLASIRRELRLAAKAACEAEYAAEGIYLFSRSCVAGSYRDALRQLKQLHDASRLGPEPAVAAR